MTTTTSPGYEGSSSWSKSSDRRTPETSYNPRLTLLDECMSMIAFASSNGLAIPEGVLDLIDRARAASLGPGANAATLAELGQCHSQLSKLVSPASPTTILLLAKEETDKHWRYLGATKYARLLFVFATTVFFAFLGLLAWSITYPGQPVLPLFLTAVASLVGAIFYVLFTANRQLRAATFDRRQEGNLSALIVLGVLSGTALAYLVVQPGSASGAADEVQTQVVLTRPLLGLLGGFAVEAVYRILQRLVTTLEALVGGSGDDLVQAQRREADARAALEATELRLALAGKLVELRGQLISLTPTERDAVQAEIDRLLGAS